MFAQPHRTQPNTSPQEVHSPWSPKQLGTLGAGPVSTSWRQQSQWTPRPVAQACVGTATGLGWEPAVQAPEPHETLPFPGPLVTVPAPPWTLSLAPRVCPQAEALTLCSPLPLPQDELTEPHREFRLFQVRLRAGPFWGSEAQTSRDKGAQRPGHLPRFSELCCALCCVFFVRTDLRTNSKFTCPQTIPPPCHPWVP